MTYRRVIPRDLFNEASLLKCLGRLAILTEDLPGVAMQYGGEGDPDEGWNIRQDEASGAIYADNVLLWIGGRVAHLERPLNSRDEWPLYLTHLDGRELGFEIEVFDSLGGLSATMQAVLAGESAEPVA